jgi:hypothetical protein
MPGSQLDLKSNYPPGSQFLLLSETLREQAGRADGRCVSAGKPAFFAVAPLGEAPLYEGEDPYGFGSYSTWGDPKTVLPHRAASPS